VSDQLQRLAAGGSAVPAHGELRKRAADYIRMHAVDFAPFLPFEPADGYDGSSRTTAVQRAVDAYCKRLAETSMWGGHPEIRALSCTVGLPIIVYQAELDPLRFTPETETFAATKRTAMDDYDVVLRLSFHRHYFALGEHYNSVVPAGGSSGSGASAASAGGWR